MEAGNASPGPVRAALYARVSSERQEREETVQSQLEALRGYAAAKGYAPPTEFVDEARSDYTLARPALDRLRDAVQSGAFDVLVVYDISRLARDRADQALLLRELRQRVRVEFIKHLTDDTAEGELLENVLGDFAHYCGRQFADLTHRGRQHVVEQGGLVASGVPFGYRFVPRTADRRATMEVDDAAAAVVREVFALLVDERMACRAICRRLTERGTPAPRGGRVWHPSVLQRILTNTAYVGRFVYGKNEAAEPQREFKPVGERNRKKSSRKALPPEQWVTIPCPPIVSEETFARTQAQLAANAQFSPRHNTRHQYLLRGLIRCGKCDSAYVGKVVSRRNGGRTRYYYCRATDAYNTGPQGACAGNGYLNADAAERTVWEACLDLLKPEVLAEEYRRRIADGEPGGDQGVVRKTQADLKPSSVRSAAGRTHTRPRPSTCRR